MKKLFLLFTCTISLAFGVTHVPKQTYPLPKKEFNAVRKLLNYFKIPYENSFEGLVDATQKYWKRKENQERWQMDPVTVKNEAYVLSLINKIGMIQEVSPQKKYYDYAFLLGAVTTTARPRLYHLVHLFEQGVRFGKIYVLSGERPLDPTRETENIFLHPDETVLKTKQVNLPLPKNESEMLRFLIKQYVFPKEFQKIPIEYISALMKKNKNGELVRPRLNDIMAIWLKTKPLKGSVLAISNQPFVHYQDLTLKMHLEGKYEIETVGYERKEHKIEVYLDQIADYLYNFKCYQDSKQKKLSCTPILLKTK